MISIVGILLEALVRAEISNKSLSTAFLMRIFGLTEFSHNFSDAKKLLSVFLVPISW